MSITFALPEPIEQSLRAQLGNLDEAAKEAMLVELYRQGVLSHGQLAESLGTSRYEVDSLLTRYNVTNDGLTLEEFTEQRAAIRKKSRR